MATKSLGFVFSWDKKPCMSIFKRFFCFSDIIIRKLEMKQVLCSVLNASASYVLIDYIVLRFTLKAVEGSFVCCSRGRRNES